MTRNELAQKVRDYLENGGKITHCPGFGDGVPLPDGMAASFQRKIDRRNNTMQKRRRQKLERLGLTVNG